jgi:hypothetical protein
MTFLECLTTLLVFAGWASMRRGGMINVLGSNNAQPSGGINLGVGHAARLYHLC